MGINVNRELKSQQTHRSAKCFQREPGVWLEKRTVMGLGLPLQEDPPASEPWEASALSSPQGVCRDLRVSVPKPCVRPGGPTSFGGQRPRDPGWGMRASLRHWAFCRRGGAVQGPAQRGVQCFRAQVAPTAGPAALAPDFPPATKLNHCIKHSPFHPNLWLGPTAPSCFAVPLGSVSVRYVWYSSRPWFCSGAIRGHEGCCWPWNRWQYPPWAHVASRSLQSLVLVHLLFWQNFCDSGGKGRISG